MPEASLHAPSSTSLFHTESDAWTTIEGSSPAFSTTIFGSPNSADDILSGLRTELMGAGWTEDTFDSSGIPTTAEERAEVWRKGDALVRLSVLRKGDPRNPAHDKASAYATHYQVTLLAKPPAKISPSSSRGKAGPRGTIL